jgi:glyoxylase-like metal-dependent hydrolase (beta-lactamase superfamily II)
LHDSTTKDAAIVDPAWEPQFLLNEIDKHHLTLKAIFLTHAHPDHVNGLDKILSQHPHLPVYINKHEAPFLRRNLRNLIDTAAGEKLQLGHINFDILHTPGHTPGCQCFLAQNQLICGDVLFIDGCGRCDLPGGDPKTMYYSLKNIISALDDDIIVWPGHNYGPTPYDSIGHQKQTNPYLQANSLEEFLNDRMGL